MRTLKEKETETVWESNMVEAPWATNGYVDNGRKVTHVVFDDLDVLLTLDDLNYYPTQDELLKYNFFAEEDVYSKLYKPYYEYRHVSKKGKVESVELKLQKL